MKKIKDVTVVCIDCNRVGDAISSIKKTLSKIEPHSTILFTDTNIEIDGIETIVIPKIKSKEEYSLFVVKELWRYITTSHVLIVQWDSWCLNEDAWTDQFLNYDVVGALWMYNDFRDNGNGGFSLKSKRLLHILATDDFIEITHPEDEICGRLYRKYLEEKHGIKFAPEHICELFSFECREPYQKTLGFHSFFHEPFIEHVVIKRTAAMGDLVMAEPIMQYYHEKGYQVVLDTLPEMMPIFFNHPYKIKHISEMNPNIKPIKVINLDMSYESKPKQIVLKTYYEFAGITDGIMRNSRLYVNQEPHQKLFHKFIVFHISDTGMTHRNCYGVNWQFVTNYYQRLGYTCIQVGSGEEVGTFFNAETKPMLMFLLKGASAVCAIDSGVAQLSVALNVPAAIFFGSVNPKLRYQDFSNIEVIHSKCVTEEDDFCYHSQESTTVGVTCKYDENKPSCTNYSEWQVVSALNKLLKL